jgi:hypothetical protein
MSSKRAAILELPHLYMHQSHLPGQMIGFSGQRVIFIAILDTLEFVLNLENFPWHLQFITPGF